MIEPSFRSSNAVSSSIADSIQVTSQYVRETIPLHNVRHGKISL